VVVDSNSPTALTESGNAQVKAATIQVVGGVQKGGNATLSPAPVTGAAAAADPLAGLAAPTGGTFRGSVSLGGTNTQTIDPGVYSQISVSGNASLTLNPGVYVIAGGGFTVTGRASVSGNGVMIYNAGSNYPNPGGSSGSVNLSGKGAISLSPAADGSYPGVLIFQARDNASAVALSSNGIVMPGGTVYAPAAALTMDGGGQFKGSLVVGTLTLSNKSVAQLRRVTARRRFIRRRRCARPTASTTCPSTGRARPLPSSMPTTTPPSTNPSTPSTPSSR
jgi:hypothetical protein